MVIQQWSKQRFHPRLRHPSLDFFFFKFIGKMLNFSVKTRDYSLTSWPEFSVIIHWQNKPFRTHTLKTSQSRSSCVHANSCLKCWRKRFLELETSGTQLAAVDQHSHRWPCCVIVRRPLLERESWRILLHSVDTDLDDESRVFIVDVPYNRLLSVTSLSSVWAAAPSAGLYLLPLVYTLKR